MGLDNLWELPEGVESPTMDVNLCGGVFSGPNKYKCTSFRGKIYSDFIEVLSGISLYSERIEGEDIKKIRDALKQFKADIDEIPTGYKVLIQVRNTFPEVHPHYVDWSLLSLNDLITMFSAYAEIEGARLVSWY